MQSPDLNWIASVAGAVVVVMILVAVIRRAWAPTPEVADRWLPIISIVLGIGVVIVADIGLGLFGRADLVQAVFTGLFAGASASGVYDAANV